jgi:hypothetical protein
MVALKRSLLPLKPRKATGVVYMANVSKFCSDAMREHFRKNLGQKLKATHACELVAAFFGYKSHAALLAEARFPISRIEEAAVMVPDVERIHSRIQSLKDLPTNLPTAFELAKTMADFLVKEGWFNGKVWLYETVENYVTEVYLIENDYRLLDELSGVMAETNAYFDEAYFENVEVTRHDDGMSIAATGTYSGTSDEDRVFSGDTIDMTVIITLDRVAGHTCFHEEDMEVAGKVNDDWYEPDFAFEDAP